MKIKLLRKVRKRFQIIHMPNGYVGFGGEHYNYNLFKLEDRDDSWNDKYVQLLNDKLGQFTDIVFYTEQECISYLKTEIIRILRYEGHRGKKDKVIKNSQKKIWHK
jgi:hypothetical protein